MKKTLFVIFAVLLLSCEKDGIIDDVDGSDDEVTWSAPNTGSLRTSLSLGINMAISETETMGMSTYKDYIRNIGNKFGLALAEVEKQSDSKNDFLSNMNKAIRIIEDNIELTKGIKAGFSEEQNKGLQKYYACAVASLDEAKKLIKD